MKRKKSTRKTKDDKFLKKESKVLYYYSMTLLLVYSVFSTLELFPLVQGKRRILQIPLMLLLFFASAALPYYCIKELTSHKKSIEQKVINISKGTIALTALLILIFFFSNSLKFCPGISCWYILIPVIWFLPNLLLSLVMLTKKF